MTPERLDVLRSRAIGPADESPDARRLWIAQMRAAIVGSSGTGCGTGGRVAAASLSRKRALAVGFAGSG